MTRFKKEEQPDLSLPEDSIHRARLTEIDQKTINWIENGTQKETEILEWWWEITATNLGPQYVGRRVKGSCSAYLGSGENNKFNAWAEALLNREIPIGADVDTDDLVGLEAEVVIGHKPNKKDPSKFFEEVQFVHPLSGAYSADPPF